METIAHIVNVTELDESKEANYLHVAQPMTLKSMETAKKACPPEMLVDLLAIYHQDEHVDLPASFKALPTINRYAWEVIDALRASDETRPLPILQDILLCAFNESDADYIIYTNVDIAVQANFYAKIHDSIARGFDAIYINRRDLPKEHNGISLDESSLDLACKLKGLRHSGLDCFVFKRDIIPRLDLGRVYIGYPPVGQVLKTQIDIHATKAKWMKNARLTFHIGRDTIWERGNNALMTNNDLWTKTNYFEAQGLYRWQFKESLWRRILLKPYRGMKRLLGWQLGKIKDL